MSVGMITVSPAHVCVFPAGRRTMQRLTLLMFVVVTTFEFLARGDKWGKFQILPGAAPYVAEILGAAALAYVIVAGTRDRFQFVRPAYWFVFGALGLSCLCGVLVNGVDSGPVFAGLRTFLRALPWFFVPAIFAFSEKQIRMQLLLLLGICILQVPLAIEQRIATTSNYQGFVAVTGDWTSGTLMISSILSILLTSAICVATAMWVRKQIPTRFFLIIFLLLLTPTLINETKGTLFLLPIGLILTFMTAAERGKRTKQLLVAAGLVAVFVAAYVPVYNLLVEGRDYQVTIGEFLSDPEKRRYLATGDEIGTTRTAGRVDAIVVPLKELSKDPVSLVFGLGIGNASNSSLGDKFTGRYFGLYEPFLVSAFARIVLELGLLGFGLLMILFWNIFADCRAVAARDAGLIGSLAAGFAGVAAIMAIALFYKDIVSHVSLSFLFWYLTGLIAASRMRLSRLQLPEAGTQAARQAPAVQNRLVDAPSMSRRLR